MNTLSAGQKNGAKGFDFFEVTVDLTEDGQGVLTWCGQFSALCFLHFTALVFRCVTVQECGTLLCGVVWQRLS